MGIGADSYAIVTVIIWSQQAQNGPGDKIYFDKSRSDHIWTQHGPSISYGRVKQPQHTQTL